MIAEVEEFPDEPGACLAYPATQHRTAPHLEPTADVSAPLPAYAHDDVRSLWPARRL